MAEGKNLEVALLLDFYGEMLTEKQREVIDLYYNQDLSLAEIAQEYQISRQGVYDLIHRVTAILEGYEEKLQLVEKFLEVKTKVKEIESCRSLKEAKQAAEHILELL